MVDFSLESLLIRASYDLTGNISGSLSIVGESKYENIEWDKTLIPNPPTKDEINTKIAELMVEEPYRRLRIHRDRLLQKCDWVTLPDVNLPEEKKTDWLNYRQALRDLPDTATPEIDGPFIKNVDWPVEPS